MSGVQLPVPIDLLRMRRHRPLAVDDRRKVFHFVVDLGDEPILALLRVAHSRLVVGCGQVCGEHIRQRLALIAQRLHLGHDVHQHRAIGLEILFLDQRAMTGDERRIRVRQLLEQIDRFEHAVDRSAVGLIGERIAEVPVEVLDVDHVGLAETDDGVARGVGGHHRDEVHGLAVHVESDGWLARAWRGCSCT